MPQEAEQLEKARNWVKGHFAENGDRSYAISSKRLSCIQLILDEGWIAPSETWKLQALGVALGDSVAEILMLDWVTVKDDFGQDPALNWPGTQILCFPLTMISKRIERGETVDVYFLLDEVCKILNDKAYSGKSL